VSLQLEHQDFATLIEAYQTPRTFFSVDPPYVRCEDYYRDAGQRVLFTGDDHYRLAALLGATPAYMALSY